MEIISNLYILKFKKIIFKNYFIHLFINYKILLLFIILISNVSEHLCVSPPTKNNGIFNSMLYKYIQKRNIEFQNEKNLTAVEVKGIFSSPLQLNRKETISLDEYINNSSTITIQFHFSSLLQKLWRVKRSNDVEEQERERLNADHAKSFRLFYFLGGIAIVIFTIIFVATLLCFCCPSCYMAKRRRPGGGESLSGSGASGSIGGQETTITAARSSSIVMAALPLQHRISQDYSAHRKSQDYSQSVIASTSQSGGFTYTVYPEITEEIGTMN